MSKYPGRVRRRIGRERRYYRNRYFGLRRLARWLRHKRR